MELNTYYIMKKIIIITLILFINTLYGQQTIYKEINSIELGATRTIKIHLPASYEKNSTRLYPLTVLFDADYLFDVYVGNTNLFEKRDKAPEQIIVGIMQSEERYQDCSTDKVSGLPTEDSNKFYRFVRGELLEYIEAKYPISPFRTLVGSALTANFVNFFLIEDVPAFDAFVVINPSYTPDMPEFLFNKLASIDDKNVYYYVNSGTYNKNEKHATIVKVANSINNLGNENVFLKFDTFQSTKTASIGQAIPAALAHIFDIYSAISIEEFNRNIAHLEPSDAIAYLENKYVEIDYLFGTNMKIRERDIYAVEGIIIDKEEGYFLEDFGIMIGRLYPETPLSDYYIGLFYEKARKYKKALKHYKNGYAKMDSNGEDAEGFYQNIERILELQNTSVEQEQYEEQVRKEERQAEKEQRKSEKEAEKEQRKKDRESGKRGRR